MTDEQLVQWERLANEATAGPWVHEAGNFESLMWMNGYVLEYTTSDDGIHGNKPSDLPFIAAARTAVPDLCAEVRRLRAELADLRGHLEEAQQIAFESTEMI